MSCDKKRSKKEEKDEEEELEFDENEEEESEDDEENEEFVDEQMELDFEGRKPENLHCNGIRTLLHQVFLKLSINVSELTDLIIKHNDVGSVLQQLSPSDDDDSNTEDDMGDDDDGGLVMSVTTVVDISGNAESEFSKQFRGVLLERCKSLPSSEELEHFLSSAENRVGLLINERITGLPPHVAILESLWKDLEKSSKTSANAYNFSHFLLFSKTLRPLVNASKKKKKQDQSDAERLFMNAEEELFHQNSSLTFEFSVKDQCDEALDGGWDDDSSQCYEPFRTISVISADKVPDIMAKLAAWITSKN